MGLPLELRQRCRLWLPAGGRFYKCFYGGVRIREDFVLYAFKLISKFFCFDTLAGWSLFAEEGFSFSYKFLESFAPASRRFLFL